MYSCRPLTPDDREAALQVINLAAQWYREFLPPGDYHTPEMTPAQWDAEAVRMAWYGAFAGAELVAVMGLERRHDAALIRHGYVLPEWQRRGAGSALLAHLEQQAGPVRVIIGTYAGNRKARALLEKSGYILSPDSEAILRRYYAIPEDRLRSSVTYEKLNARS
jgi:GNAT superfamily N-acetyltransferase